MMHISNKVIIFLSCIVIGWWWWTVLVSAQDLVEKNQRMSRFEFAEQLESLQCRDCVVPVPSMKEQYNAFRRQTQQQDPTHALDDIWFEDPEEYYYCVASVVDAGVMNGFPRGVSPYCPGKFCGESYLTVAELLEALTRLLWSVVRDAYAIDWSQMAEWATTQTSLTLTDRQVIAWALRRCGVWPCRAESIEEFGLWMRRCGQSLDRCGMSPIGDFKNWNSLTVALQVLFAQGILPAEAGERSRFQVLTRDQIVSVLHAVERVMTCDTRDDDYDRDGIANRDDVCPYQYNHLQYDTDSDGKGDVCDDDIDGDGWWNVIGVVDPFGMLIPELAKKSDDPCIFTRQEDQDNLDCKVTGGGIGWLQITATPLYGTAPLLVQFSGELLGTKEPIRRDFADSHIIKANTPAHVFAKWGIYSVRASAQIDGKTLGAMVPIWVEPSPKLQVWLEWATKDLIQTVGWSVELLHVVVGQVQKLIWSVDNRTETVDPQQWVTIPLLVDGIQQIELQAYNGAGDWVALSQLSIDTRHQIGSYIHTPSLVVAVWEELEMTTIMGWFDESMIQSVEWNAGDGTASETTQSLLHTFRRTDPGVYLVRQYIDFRNPLWSDHANALTIIVKQKSWWSLQLAVDALEKPVWDPFVARLLLQGQEVSSLDRCLWRFGQEEMRTIDSVTASSLIQRKTFDIPWMYLIQASCLDVSWIWKTATVTVTAFWWAWCLWENALLCDLDKDGVPDLCDDDIDGDGQTNWMGLITKELPDCSIGTGNTNTALLYASQTACQQWASLDNCPFWSNPGQTDADQDGVWAACDPDDTDSAVPGWWDGWWSGWWSVPWWESDWWGDTGDSDADGVWWDGVWWDGWWDDWSSDPNADDDGDGIPNSSDACDNTPESANGSSDGDGCPEAPQEHTDEVEEEGDNPFVQVADCTQCPCPQADYASALRKGDRVRALLLDEWGSIIYRYTKPEIIEKDIPTEMGGG